MNKTLLYLSLFFLTIISCNPDTDPVNPTPEISQDLAQAKNELDQLIVGKILDKGADFRWRDLSDEEIWAAFQYSDNTVIVGWDIDATDSNSRTELLDFVRESEGYGADENFIIDEIEGINTLFLKVEKKETVLALKKMTQTADLFEIGYKLLDEEQLTNMQNASGKGPLMEKAAQVQYGGTPGPYNVERIMGQTIKYPRRYSFRGINTAWKMGLSGDKVKVAVIDNGLIPSDLLFGQYNPKFHGNNPSYLRSRSLERYSRYKWCGGLPGCNWVQYESVWNQQQHGTSMMHLLGAPMSTPNESFSTGIAYASDLVAIRGSNYIFTDDLKNAVGIAKAFEMIAFRSNAQIVSLSQGGVIPWNFMQRAIRNCTRNNKLVFAAAGTLPEFMNQVLGWTGTRETTIFPANMSQTIACTGVERGGQYWCRQCHGSADFIVEFEKNQNEGAASSQSTAIMASMAALIWGNETHLTAQEVKNRLIQFSEFGHARQGWKGHGRFYIDRYASSFYKGIIPLYRYYAEKAVDHFYTTNWNELRGGNSDYYYEGIAAFVWPTQQDGMVPIYRYYNAVGIDHFYTTNWDELGHGNYGFTFEGTVGYVLKNQIQDTYPIHRYNLPGYNHFYTINWGELGSGAEGYQYEGILGYAREIPLLRIRL